MSIPANDQCPFVHHSIAEFLRCRRQHSQSDKREHLVEPSTLAILFNASEHVTVIDPQTLIELAQDSNIALFEEGTDASPLLRPLLQGLLHLSDENTVAATLLALNFLESAVRRNTNHTTGNAPLLKTMLQQLDDRQVAPILKCLLLPHRGLNLRNLLWHGFVTCLPRPWFALIVVLIHHLEQNQGDIFVPSSIPVLPDLRAHSSMQQLLETNMDNTLCINTIRDCLPVTHQGLFDLATQWKDTYPACATALLSIIIEHYLRVEWCQYNNQPHDCIAHPDAYYVTLDGHGQRNHHELLLHPYCQQKQQPNALMLHLHAGTVALLTDLFASACGGPNIRAALAHGAWDSFLEEEIVGCNGMMTRPNILKSKSTVPTGPLEERMQLVLLALYQVVTKLPLSYKPLFSYTATTTQNLASILDYLEKLHSLQSSNVMAQIARYSFEIPRSGDFVRQQQQQLLQLRVPMDILYSAVTRLSLDLPRTRSSSTQAWSTTTTTATSTLPACQSNCFDVYKEYESNVVLSNSIATRTLLLDISKAVQSHYEMLKEIIQNMAEQSSEDMDVSPIQQRKQLRQRQRQRSMRILYMADNSTLSLYSFMTRLAIFDLESKFETKQLSTTTAEAAATSRDPSGLTPTLLLKAVERSRMCLSTFSTFLPTNYERAIKSVMEYLKGKATKAILAKIQDEIIVSGTLEDHSIGVA